MLERRLKSSCKFEVFRGSDKAEGWKRSEFDGKGKRQAELSNEAAFQVQSQKFCAFLFDVQFRKFVPRRFRCSLFSRGKWSRLVSLGG